MWDPIRSDPVPCQFFHPFFHPFFYPPIQSRVAFAHGTDSPQFSLSILSLAGTTSPLLLLWRRK